MNHQEIKPNLCNQKFETTKATVEHLDWWVGYVDIKTFKEDSACDKVCDEINQKICYWLCHFKNIDNRNKQLAENVRQKKIKQKLQKSMWNNI